MLIFAIPIRHPDNVRDKDTQLAYLDQTVRSIAAQTSGNYRLVIVANHGQALPDLPPQAVVEWVDLPPNTALAQARDREEVYRAILGDKGRRVRAALRHAGPDDALMVVDDDDLISRNLVAYYEEQGQSGAHIITQGYLWADGDTVLRPEARFNDLCGTSLIIPVSYFADVSAPEMDEEARIAELGSHKIIFRRHPKDRDFREVPFAGAIYRQGHGNASQSDLGRVINRASEAGQVLMKALLQGNFRRIWKDGRRVLGRIAGRFHKGRGAQARVVPLDAARRAEFFGE